MEKLKVTMASSVQENLGQKLFDGKTKTIYSMLDQPGLVYVIRKDSCQMSNNSEYIIPGSRRSSIDTAVRVYQQPTSTNHSVELAGIGHLVSSITGCVYEILREASIPTFYLAAHCHSSVFIARKCTMIPILWIIRRVADQNYVQRNPTVVKGHRFVPVLVEIYHKRNISSYRRASLNDGEENLESSRESLLDDDDLDNDEYLSSIWSYDQLLNAHFDIETLKITRTEIEYMYETACAVFDILEHIWLVKKNCQLIDLKLEFGITSTNTKEIVLANSFDIDSWHIERLNEKSTNESMKETLIWINNSLCDILQINFNLSSINQCDVRRKGSLQQKPEETSQKHRATSIDENYWLSQSMTSRCVIVCSTRLDIDQGQKLKTLLTELYKISSEVRLCSLSKSVQTITNFLSTYTHEHGRPTVFVTLGNLNNGLASCLASNTLHPVIHCFLGSNEQQRCIIDSNSFLSCESNSFLVVFTIQSALLNVVQLLAINDWKLWAKQRGRRLKDYLDLLLADQQLIMSNAKHRKQSISSGILTTT